MKQAIMGGILGAVATAALLVGSAQAGLFDSVTTAGWPSKVPVAKYKVDVKGFDVRAYEWVSEEDPNVRIVFVAGEKSSGVGTYRVGSE